MKQFKMFLFCALGNAYIHSVSLVHQIFGLLVWVPCHNNWAVPAASEANGKIQLRVKSAAGRSMDDKQSLS